jgi:diguanylate cyclase (GGDEF)-like protein
MPRLSTPTPPSARIITLVGDLAAPLATQDAQGASDSYLVTVMVGSRFDGILPVGSQGLMLGRAKDADKTLSDPFVSERHARIDRRADGCYVEDLGSANGTFVGRRRITSPTKLWDGALIRIGRDVRLKVGLYDAVSREGLVQLYESSMTDVLTGAGNRRHYETRLSEEIAHARRHAEPLALILLDVDGLKQVNDAHGHATGDALLQVFTEAIRRTLRPGDALSRIGGDEFVVLARGTSAANAAILAERLRRAIDHLNFTAARPGLHATASIGVASTNGRAGPQGLLAEADLAVYEAKRAGGNRVVSVAAP